jgi:ferric-dicitrate binding protein FerR (iron transport regulator)
VWLNAGSFLKYNNLYNVKNRTVMLKGEAFFDVRKNPRLTFIVQTPGIEVKAIGTKFNIKSYPEEKTISATVVEGKIQIFNHLENKRDRNALTLTARQSASFRKEFTASPVTEPKSDNKILSVARMEEIPAKIIQMDTDINTDLFVSWHEGKLIIERETLGSLAVKLERKYNVRMFFQDPVVKDYVFSGVLKDETFEQVMDVIRLTSPIHFSVEGNTVSLSEDKSRKKRLN